MNSIFEKISVMQEKKRELVLSGSYDRPASGATSAVKSVFKKILKRKKKAQLPFEANVFIAAILILVMNVAD